MSYEWKPLIYTRQRMIRQSYTQRIIAHSNFVILYHPKKHLKVLRINLFNENKKRIGSGTFSLQAIKEINDYIKEYAPIQTTEEPQIYVNGKIHDIMLKNRKEYIQNKKKKR